MGSDTWPSVSVGKLRDASFKLRDGKWAPQRRGYMYRCLTALLRPASNALILSWNSDHDTKVGSSPSLLQERVASMVSDLSFGDTKLPSTTVAEPICTSVTSVWIG